MGEGERRKEGEEKKGEERKQEVGRWGRPKLQPWPHRPSAAVVGGGGGVGHGDPGTGSHTRGQAAGSPGSALSLRPEDLEVGSPSAGPGGPEGPRVGRGLWKDGGGPRVPPTLGRGWPSRA